MKAEQLDQGTKCVSIKEALTQNPTEAPRSQGRATLNAGGLQRLSFTKEEELRA